MSPRPRSRFTAREPYLGVDLGGFVRLPGFLEELGPRLRTLQAAGCEAVVLPLSAGLSDPGVLGRNNVRCQGIAYTGPIDALVPCLDEAFEYGAEFVVVDTPESRGADDDADIAAFADSLATSAKSVAARGMRLLVRNRPGDTAGGSSVCRLARAAGHPGGLVGYCIDVYALWGDGTAWELFVAETGNRIHLVEFRDEWDGTPVAFGTGDLPFKEFASVLDRISGLHGIHFAASRPTPNLMDIAIASLGAIQDIVDR